MQIERYEKGMLEITVPAQDDNCDVNHYGCWNCEQVHNKDNTRSVFLPHSCDEWLIGGRAEIEALIADLQAPHWKHCQHLDDNAP